MTVSELIQELQNFSGDAEVYCFEMFGDKTNVEFVEEVPKGVLIS